MFSTHITLGIDASTANTEREYVAQLSDVDLLRHLFVVGKTGSGKTTLLETIALELIEAGAGVCFIDPHGDAVRNVLEYIPHNRARDVALINPHDTAHPVAFNVLAGVAPDTYARTADGVVSTLQHIWGDSWGPRLHDILYNTIYALIESKRGSLASIPRFLNDARYRACILGRVTHPDIRAYWFDEYAKYSDNYRIEVTSSTLNKVRRLLVHPAIKNTIGATTNRLDMRRIMDSGHIVLADLSKGALGAEAVNLLGGLLVHHIHHTALTRGDVAEAARRPFFLVVDEFQNFGTGVFREILSEARKYGLGVILATQFGKQIEESVHDAVIGNAGSLIAFRVGADDALALHRELDCNQETLLGLPRFTARVRLLSDGQAINAQTLITVKQAREAAGKGW